MSASDECDDIHLRDLFTFSGTSACWELGRPGPSMGKSTNGAWLVNPGMSSRTLASEQEAWGWGRDKLTCN